MSKKERYEIVLGKFDYFSTMDKQHVILSIVGRDPASEPYLRIGLVDGGYIASTSSRSQLKKLADKIYEHMGHELP